MTISLLPFKLNKIWLKYHFYSFISIIRLKTKKFLRPKIHKTRILPKVGNMTLLPNPGKPGFYGVGLPGRVISGQPWLYRVTLTTAVMHVDDLHQACCNRSTAYVLQYYVL